MTNPTITLRARPRGAVTRDDFGFEQREAPMPSPGKLVLSPLYLSVDPYMRGRMNDRKSYIAPFALGEPIISAGIGRVIAVAEGSKFAVGELVGGLFPWQAQALVDEKALRKANPNLPLTAQLGVLGMPGLTAFVGLMDIGKPQPGQTVFVSAAAGAVGGAVGQLAKIHGCRAIGSAGSDDKVRYLKEELGFDGAFNYKTTDAEQALAELCPQGIDVYFDNVGGKSLQAAIAHCNDYARIPVCGMIAGYEQEAEGPNNLVMIVQKQITMTGFLVTSHAARMSYYAPAAARWLAEGKLASHVTVIEGFERAPDAFIGLLRGDNIGKMVVRVGDA
ncbi:MAG TPA: NADP-dependent oxidoreductase [Polyangiales bacterium]